MPSTAKRKEKKRFLEDKFIIPSHNKKKMFPVCQGAGGNRKKKSSRGLISSCYWLFFYLFHFEKSLIITAGPCMKKIKDDNLVPGSPEDWTSSPLSPVAGYQGMLTNRCGNTPTKDEQRAASKNCWWLCFHRRPGSFVLGNLGSCVQFQTATSLMHCMPTACVAHTSIYPDGTKMEGKVETEEATVLRGSLNFCTEYTLRRSIASNLLRWLPGWSRGYQHSSEWRTLWHWLETNSITQAMTNLPLSTWQWSPNTNPRISESPHLTHLPSIPHWGKKMDQQDDKPCWIISKYWSFSRKGRWPAHRAGDFS